MLKVSFICTDNLRVALVAFFLLLILIIQVANLITSHYTVILSHFTLIATTSAERVYKTFKVPSEKSRIVYLTVIMQKIVVFPAHYRFPVKLICCIAF